MPHSTMTIPFHNFPNTLDSHLLTAFFCARLCVLGLSCLPRSHQYLERCLNHSRCSINILSKFIHLIIKIYLHRRNWFRGLPKWLIGKEYAYNAGDAGSISGLGRPLEKDIATHSSILAWEIPWTEEPGRLQSMGSQRVRLDWVTKQQKQSGGVRGLPQNHIAWPEVLNV